MEDNNKTDQISAPAESESTEPQTPSVTNTEAVVDTQSQPKSAPQEVAEQVNNQPKQLRKNGRNRSGARVAPSSKQQTQTVSCGEVADTATFTEKLSGANIGGYSDNQSEENADGQRRPSRERGERGERGERRPRRDGDRQRKPYHERNQDTPDTEEKESVKSVDTESESVESAESNATENVEHMGPSFESAKPQKAQRTIEVGLSDRRPKFSNENKSDGVVSYSSDDCKCPSISLWTRIKEAIASLFGKKSKKNERNGKRNWKHGDKKFRNDRGDRKGGHGNYNRGDRKGGNNYAKKRHFNDRRPNGGNRPKTGDKPQS